MDRVERETTAWVNKFLTHSQITKQYAELPQGSIDTPEDYPVARVISRALMFKGHRSPGPNEFDATATHYSYWRGTSKMVGSFPPIVCDFNRRFDAGQFPHLVS